LFWVTTDLHDLSAEQIALIFKLRWEIEKFFAWWKRHLKIYHLIARNEHGIMVQILAGQITYLLLVIYCRECYYRDKMDPPLMSQTTIKKLYLQNCFSFKSL